jgi:hypothetical protein
MHQGVRCAGLWAARVRAGGASLEGACIRAWQEGGQLVVFGGEGALDGRYGTGVASRRCFEAMLAQPVHSTSIHPCAKPLALPC